MAAFNCYMSVVEYAIPKLQRQEITGKDGERLQINVVAGFDRPMIEAEFKEVLQVESSAPFTEIPNADS